VSKLTLFGDWAYNAQKLANRGVSLSNDKEWLTVEDIYQELGKTVPLDTIRSWIRTKRLSAYRPGKAYLVKREDLDKFLEGSRTKPDDPA
jgi:excisionase family DNA binding protein